MDKRQDAETKPGGVNAKVVAELQALVNGAEAWFRARPEIEEFGIGLDPAGRPCIRIGVAKDRSVVERRVAERFPNVCTFVKPAPAAQAYGDGQPT